MNLVEIARSHLGESCFHLRGTHVTTQAPWGMHSLLVACLKEVGIEIGTELAAIASNVNKISKVSKAPSDIAVFLHEPSREGGLADLYFIMTSPTTILYAGGSKVEEIDYTTRPGFVNTFKEFRKLS